jgi:uncharacterized protein (DUF2249 family)
MAERFNQQKTHKSDSETNLPTILDQVSRLDASSTTKSTVDDDLILSLQSCLENRRARQVFEWELTRRGDGIWKRLSGAV